MNPTTEIPVEKPRRKRVRDLTKAVMLRPAEVFELYGIHPSVLCRLAKHTDESKRIPSVLIGGKSGRKGVRLVKQADLIAFLERHAA